MRFHLVDRIVALKPGKSLQAVKHLTLAEEYLADHFPTFPVMPGVLQLQTLVEAGAWLVRWTEDFARSVWVLREAKNVKFGTFVPPGHRMMLSIELAKLDGHSATFKGRGEVDGSQTVSAQITLAGFNLRDRNPAWAERDERLVRHLRSHGSILRGELTAGRGAD
jgi:3-hydroxyacyl-[acyl-carrier-protein] dehydratase